LKHRFLLTAVLSPGVCLAMPAYGQVATQQPQNPGAAVSQTSDQPAAGLSTPQAAPPVAASSGLGEIVVTAQRTSQSLQKVPIAVTAVTAANLQSRQITGTEEIQAAVPNLTISENGVSVTPFLRGVGSNQSNPNDEPSVATYVDGVYIASPTGNIFKFNDVEQIEVLKGPQGTLFGRNATGGVIQIITRDPQQTPLLETSVGYGNYNSVSANAYATTGITSNLAIDVSAVWDKNFDGYGTDINRHADIFKRDELGFRSKIMWTPGDRTKIRLSGDYSRLNSTGTDYQLAQGVIGVDGVSTYPGRRKTDTDFPNLGDNRVYGGSLRIDHDLDFARFVSISAYRHVVGDYHLDQDATTAPVVLSFINQYARTVSQEVQLLNPTGSKLTWLLGGYYFNAHYAYTPLTIEGLAAAPFSREDLFGSQTTNSLSAYGQMTYPITDSTHLTGGLRFTHERQSTDGHIVADGITIVPDIPQKQGINRLTWRAAVDHSFTSDILGYLSYNRGIKSGGFNMINPGTPGYKPETLDAYEAGLKTQFFDHRIRINLAGFYYNYKDIQVFNITGGGAVLTTNAAKAHVYGMDLDFAFKMSNALTFSAGFGYLNAHYTSFPNATFTPASPLDGPQMVGNASGNDLIFAPKTSANASLDYAIPVSFGKVSADASVQYRDRVYVSADNRLEIPAYAVMNASAGWTSQDNRFSVTVWARNLLNQDYYANRTEQALGDIQYLAPPRTFGVTLGFKTR
jgi:iron complex outermembrane receptor protein